MLVIAEICIGVHVYFLILSAITFLLFYLLLFIYVFLYFKLLKSLNIFLGNNYNN